MSPECPRCSVPIAALGGQADGWACPEHGEVDPLYRTREVDYDAFAAHLLATHDFPTYLPWPLSPGWRITDVAAVGGSSTSTRATLTGVAGTSELDGPVDITVVIEEAGVGLGARCAGLAHADPGRDFSADAPSVRVRLDHQHVPLWSVSTSAAGGDLDRSVVAGEAAGRWVWIVVRPASALLLLRDDWILRDVSGLGPPLVELPFGGPAPRW